MHSVPVPPSTHAPPGAVRSCAAEAGVDDAEGVGAGVATGVDGEPEPAGAVAGGAVFALEHPTTTAVAATSAAVARPQPVPFWAREVMAIPPEGFPGNAREVNGAT